MPLYSSYGTCNTLDMADINSELWIKILYGIFDSLILFLLVKNFLIYVIM